MSRIRPAEIEGNAFSKAMGHRPEIAAKWSELDTLMRFSGTLDPAMKEEVRRSLAEGIGCRFCASLGAPDPTKHDRKTALAVAFAQTVFDNMGDLYGIDDEVFEVLKSEFSEAQITELSIWTLFMIAGQAFGALMKVPPATEGELGEYLAWRSDGEAAGRRAAAE